MQLFPYWLYPRRRQRRGISRRHYSLIGYTRGAASAEAKAATNLIYAAACPWLRKRENICLVEHCFTDTTTSHTHTTTLAYTYLLFFLHLYTSYLFLTISCKGSIMYSTRRIEKILHI